MQSGIVKWFNNEKGFGFITSMNKEYFVHFRSLPGDGFRMLKEGQKVSFNVMKQPKGDAAVDVVIESD